MCLAVFLLYFKGYDECCNCFHWAVALEVNRSMDKNDIFNSSVSFCKHRLCKKRGLMQLVMTTVRLLFVFEQDQEESVWFAQLVGCAPLSLLALEWAREKERAVLGTGHVVIVIGMSDQRNHFGSGLCTPPSLLSSLFVSSSQCRPLD